MCTILDQQMAFGNRRSRNTSLQITMLIPCEYSVLNSQDVRNYTCRRLVTSLPLLQNADTNLLTELTDCLEFEMFQPGNFLRFFLLFFTLLIFSRKQWGNFFHVFCFEHCFNEKRDGAQTQRSEGEKKKEQDKQEEEVVGTQENNSVLQWYARFNDFQIRNSARGWVIDGLAVVVVGGTAEGRVAGKNVQK